MAGALAYTLTRHARVILIGSDIIDLRARDLIDALQRLAGEDEIVLGPAADGGYWLVGMRESQPTLFTDLSWGMPDIYSLTVARLEALKRHWSALPTRHDIDTLEDVTRWRVELDELASCVPTFPIAE